MEVVALLERQRHRATALEVSLHTGWTVEDSEEALNRLMVDVRGTFEISGEDGRVLYSFPRDARAAPRDAAPLRRRGALLAVRRPRAPRGRRRLRRRVARRRRGRRAAPALALMVAASRAGGHRNQRGPGLRGGLQSVHEMPMNASPPAAASYNKIVTPRKRRSRAAPGSQEPVPKKKPRADVVEARGRPSLADATKAPAPAVDQPPEARARTTFRLACCPRPRRRAPEPAETIMFEEQPPSEQISILQQFPESFVDRAAKMLFCGDMGELDRPNAPVELDDDDNNAPPLLDVGDRREAAWRARSPPATTGGWRLERSRQLAVVAVPVVGGEARPRAPPGRLKRAEPDALDRSWAASLGESPTPRSIAAEKVVYGHELEQCTFQPEIQKVPPAPRREATPAKAEEPPSKTPQTKKKTSKTRLAPWRETFLDRQNRAAAKAARVRAKRPDDDLDDARSPRTVDDGDDGGAAGAGPRVVPPVRRVARYDDVPSRLHGASRRDREASHHVKDELAGCTFEPPRR
ncbi:hypothetical protein SO694_00066124 [Aureococcus anophagefferens]|uniref:TFIIE beta domain-containing protein n=1 Tax=Aureococcus anophagefferens TaxID=44056 RepID=A0ABR1FQI1_AURAN